VSRARLLFVFLGSILVAASGFLVYAGLEDARLVWSGPRRDFTAAELPPKLSGVVAVVGCVRHELAVGVTRHGDAYKLGTAAAGASDEDLVYTPISAADDCDEERAPRRLFAIVQDDDGLDNTIGRVYQHRVAPPPVPAIVDGVVGFHSARQQATAAARAIAAARAGGSDASDLPIIAKGKRPGVLWVALVTVAAGLHGFLLLAVVALWMRRRERRRTAAAEFSEQENEFLNDDLE
jgi:hypothetical protein